jgi:DNA polymerase III sliding clamp (beta) subunit (PCNA family)
VQTIGKRLKITCGNNTTSIADNEWIGKKTRFSYCEIRVCPKNTIIPNVGNVELAEAINRVLPYTSNKKGSIPLSQYVFFRAKDGKLTLIGCDGYRMAVTSLDYEGEGEAIIYNNDLMGIASAIKRASRVRVSFDKSESSRLSTLTFDTELIRYQWVSSDSTFIAYENLIPQTPRVSADIDTVEVLRNARSIISLAETKDYPIDLLIGDGTLVMTDIDDKSRIVIPTNTSGETEYARVNGKYLFTALKACGGMATLNLSPMQSTNVIHITRDDYQVVIMPMVAKDRVQKTEAEEPHEAVPNTEEEVEELVEAVADSDSVTERPKRKRKDKVAV